MGEDKFVRKDVFDLYVKMREREHELMTIAATKAEGAMEHRLEGMNEFRSQLSSQASSFLTRDSFDKYTNDLESKMEIALTTMTDKDEALTRATMNRHDSDFNSLRDLIQAEREIRRGLEGSINTWKWLAGFLGASGIAGVILLFATRGQ